MEFTERSIKLYVHFALLALCVPVALAQSDQSLPKLPNGLRIPATLKSGLSSQKSKVGNPVKLDVYAAVHGKDGKVMIPAHATLTGTVTQVSPFGGAGKRAALAFAVQRADWKGGQGSLDAAVFGVLAIPDFRKVGFGTISPKDDLDRSQVLRGSAEQGEIVEDLRTVTLRHQDSLDVVDCRILSEIHDTYLAHKVMELDISTDPVVRTYFASDKEDVVLSGYFFVVLLNGMKVVQ